MLSEIKGLINASPSLRDLEGNWPHGQRKEWAEDLQLPERAALLSTPETQLMETFGLPRGGIMDAVAMSRMVEVSSVFRYVISTLHDPHELSLLVMALPTTGNEWRRHAIKRLEDKAHGSID